MKRTVYWTYFAEKKLDSIYSYYTNIAGKRVAQKLVNEIVEKSIKMEKSPFIGQLEPLLENRKEKFRYIIHGNFKLIYWINELKNQIEIVNLFDCRQNPVLLEAQTK